VSCSDYVVSSYTPTLGALLKAQENFVPVSPHESTALVVAEAAAPGFPVLPDVKEEIKVVRQILSSASVSLHSSTTSSGATVDNVVHDLAGSSIAHFACHGVQDSDSPLKSGFCLHDGTLTVAELMKLNVPDARFAFLSACETAQGDRDQPDQAVHLCAAMLFCGFKSIVGTLW
jgi:CHAT domain-containing protein